MTEWQSPNIYNTFPYLSIDRIAENAANKESSFLMVNRTFPKTNISLMFETLLNRKVRTEYTIKCTLTLQN